MSKKKGEGSKYLLIHCGIFGNSAFDWFDDLDAARRRFAAYKELGMTTSASGIYLKVEDG